MRSFPFLSSVQPQPKAPNLQVGGTPPGNTHHAPSEKNGCLGNMAWIVVSSAPLTWLGGCQWSTRYYYACHIPQAPMQRGGGEGERKKGFLSPSPLPLPPKDILAVSLWKDFFVNLLLFPCGQLRDLHQCDSRKFIYVERLRGITVNYTEIQSSTSNSRPLCTCNIIGIVLIWCSDIE